MNFIGNIFKNKSTRIWFIVTAVVLVLIIIVDVAAAFFASSFDLWLGGGPRPIVEERVLEITQEEVFANGYALSEEIAEEGFVLLKNESNALPLKAAEKRISVFGKNSVKLVYGASGSGGKTGTNGIRTIFESLESAGFIYNTTLKNFYESSASGAGRPTNPKIDSGGSKDLATGETPQSSYSDTIKESYTEYKDAALIVLSRIGGEGWDLPRANGLASGTAVSPEDHYLRLDKNEIDLIAAVSAEGFTKIIVLINSNNPMELGVIEDDSRVDGCIWLGTPGDSGIMALGRLLNGEVSPSGRLVDTYARDFTKDPVWVNFGNMNKDDGHLYLNANGSGYVGSLYTFVDYEEDIYVGYRYYETRGFIEGGTWYEDNVVYSFGYGKSYADFKQEFSQEPTSLNLTNGNKFNVKVKVTNESASYAKPAKDAVQIYVTAPYNASTAKVEKSYVVLAAFDKSKAIAPGAANADELEIEIDPYLFASYDVNTNGGCFVLEAGDYVFRLGKSAHEFYDTFTMNVPAKIEFKDGVNGKVENRFADAADSTQLQSTLSRSNFRDTMPEARTDSERRMNADLKAKLDNRTPNNPIVNNPPEYPDTNIASSLTLLDMVTESYDSDLWDTFIKTFTINEMTKLVTDGQFKTASIERDGVIVPATICTDGPFGFTNFMNEAYEKVYYPSEVLIASTWNPELAVKFGESVGDEALVGAGEIPISGWYAPGVNIHRSPFGGRVSEYFSEDPIMSGKMAAGVVKGARDRGVMTFVKHFAVNEQETSRQGMATWLTEQALREIYLRPFELAVKEGKTLAMMSSFNRIGAIWAGGDYRLLTEVLRNEWGFEGMVVCDYFVDTSLADTKQMIYAGGDLHLIAVAPAAVWFKPSASNAADITILQTASKNILYAVSRSNITGVTIVGYRMAVWNIMLIVANAVIIAGLLGWGAIVIIRMVKSGKKTS